MIPFNIPLYIGKEEIYISEAIKQRKICGDGEFTKKCNKWFEKRTGSEKCLLTTSCTHALEMAALLCDVGPGDEVIMPSYTFVSTADAFVLRGAVPVFVDIRPDTMNIDERLIEAAITERTKAIVAVHYAGVACEMHEIMRIAKKYKLKVVEDAAQAVLATYDGRALGTFGDFGCYSFHETKNYSMGEGGALLIHNDADVEPAEILREKGTNRNQFFRGMVDKYTWVDKGSSYLPSELNAAYLYGQLEEADYVNHRRREIYFMYEQGLKELEEQGYLELPKVPKGCEHNAHMFYIKVKDLQERSAFIQYMKEQEISVSFHYIPLHTAPAGLKYGRFNGEDRWTTRESERLVRLPMYYELQNSQVETVLRCVKNYWK